MSDDTCETCGFDNEHEKTKGYELGRLSRLKDLAEEYRDESGQRFANGDDDEARWYRRRAEELEMRHDEERERWEEKYR